jgi:hypothetical protein
LVGLRGDFSPNTTGRASRDKLLLPLKVRACVPVNEDGNPSSRKDTSMGTDAPMVVTISVHCAPKKAPCPTCGKHGRRDRKLPPRKVRTVVFKAIASLE